jgi:amidohydrolase
MDVQMNKIIPEIKENYQTLRKWRHKIHLNPELSFEEHSTAKFVAELLKSFGCDEVIEGIAGTGVVGILKNGEGPSIGLRADMDALPIDELGTHNYRSKNDGVMHACGHDGHTVMLLGAVQHMAKHRDFSGTIVFIFQPAEEKILGAPAMINDGLMHRFPFDSIYTLHSWPGAPVNSMFVNEGAVMACVNNFDITIKAGGGHAAMPHLSADPIVAGAQIIMALQTLVSRRNDPQEALVISNSVFHGGTVRNVIPSSVTIQGTARYITPEIGQWLPKRMRDIVEGIARVHDVTTDFEFIRQCPPTINSSKEARLAKNVIDELLGTDTQAHKKKVSMGSDDFCFYLEEVPGAYVYIGNGIESKSLHHPEYDFNDEALLIGASFYVRLIQKNCQ